MAKTKHADKNNPPQRKSKGDKVKEAADKAQATADKKAAAQTEKDAKAAAKEAEKAPKPVRFSDPANAEDKALFFHHLPKIKEQREAVTKAVNNLRTLYKTAKSDGFVKEDFDIGIQLESVEQEAKVRAKIARTLTIAQYQNCDLGAQLDMFLEPTRVPASDRAYAEGEKDAMQHSAAKPSYDPSTEQHRRYMEGYHSVQAKQIQHGIAKPEAAPTLIPKGSKGDGDVKTVKPVTVPEKPTSGMAMTRADFEREKQRKIKEEADKVFARETAAAGAAAGDTTSMFQKKAAAPA